MNGLIFSMEEFSVYDGPGIRSTVFFKGCPLQCSWCHNPEGQKAIVEIVRSRNGCIDCKQCIHNGILQNGVFSFTEASIKKCPMGLLRKCGWNMESHQLCNKILKNLILLKNGGVTFSGGEPFFQGAFLLECLRILHGTIHTAIQTSGYCDADLFDEALELADYFLFDLKLADPTEHLKFTGVSNEKILRNFSTLAGSGKEFVVRIPLIPGVTDRDENIHGIVQILKSCGVSYVELLPYNKMAGGKYSMLGRSYEPDFDEHQAVRIPEAILKENQIQYMVL